MPFPPEEKKPEQPPSGQSAPPPPPNPEEEKGPDEKEYMQKMSEKLAEMTSILKEIQSSLMATDNVRKEKEGVVVTEVNSPDVTNTNPESAGMKGKSQSGSPPTKRTEEPMVKELENRVLATVRKELRLGSVGAVRPEGDSQPLPGESNIHSFVKEAINGKKMTAKDIQEVVF